MSDERLLAIEVRLTAVEKALIRDEVVGEVVTKRLDKIEDTLVWLVRLIIGTIVSGLLLFIIRGGLAPLS
jgi:hypothetical protein